MKLPTKIGVDNDGYIINPTAKERIQIEFKPALTEVRTVLSKLFGEKLHSIYLYGSVGRGEADPGTSDLDLTVILLVPLTLVEKTKLANETECLLDRFKIISKIDYDFGYLHEVTSEDNRYDWGFWLHHMCTCLSGIDLSAQFGKMKPNWKVSAALNRDFCQSLNSYERELLDPSKEVSQIKRRSIVKRMIRGAYLMINVQDESWSTKSVENLHILQSYFPQSTLFQEMEVLLYSEEKRPDQLLRAIKKMAKWVSDKENAEKL